MRKFLVALFVVLNLADAILTYIGVSRGIPEKNPFVFALISAFGLVEGLIIAKSMALAGAWILYHSKYYGLLFPLSGVVLAFAVIPWLWILSSTS